MRYTYDILGRRTQKIDSSKSTANPETTIYVYSGDNILSEYKTVGSWSLTLRKNYINGIGTDSVIAYDVDESTNQDQISFCQNRVLPYQTEFTTYGYTSIVDDCNNVQNSSTGIVTNRYYYHTNQLWSVIALTNSTGAVVQVYSYDSFGKVYISSGSWILTPLDTYSGSTYSNSRLYTGRELDKETGMYYLRARYYNSDTGKFISRDPIGQNDQVNLYTYVANSPLKYVDRMGLSISGDFNRVFRDFYDQWYTDIYKDVQNEGQAYKEASLQILETLPISGDISDIQGLVTSRTLYKCDSISNWDKTLVVLWAILPVINSSQLKFLKKSIWTSNRERSSVQNAFGHWKDHKSEFPELENATQYVKKAQNFFSNPPSGVIKWTRTTNGDTIFYDSTENLFWVLNNKWLPKTFYKPDPIEHGFSTNLEYVLSQFK